jgi:uncharacterized RDD family membrane protein YckC
LASSLVDPDAYDLSEERFSASLGEVAADSSGGTGRQHSSDEVAWKLVGAMAAPAVRAQAGVESQEANRGVDDGAIWRNEVASRVESYRARRRRPIRERSLPLDFERAVNREITHGSLAASEGEELASAAHHPAFPQADAAPLWETELESPDPELAIGISEPTPDLEPWTDDSSKIIEFPRQPMLPVSPPCFEELAEPIIDRPRILEAPEEVDTASPLSDISVAPEEEQPVVEFELPLQVASMSRRIIAGLLDSLIVLLGAAVFVVIAHKCGVPVPRARADFLLLMVAPCIFWAMYEYLFLVYAGVTPGLQLTRLRLITFDGVQPRRPTRRARSIAMMLSTFSLGLGLLWAALDEDTLCWHDRITRTYVVGGNT